MAFAIKRLCLCEYLQVMIRQLTVWWHSVIVLHRHSLGQFPLALCNNYQHLIN